MYFYILKKTTKQITRNEWFKESFNLKWQPKISSHFTFYKMPYFKKNIQTVKIKFDNKKKLIEKVKTNSFLKRKH